MGDKIHCVHVFDEYVKPFLSHQKKEDYDANEDTESKEEIEEDEKTGSVQNLVILAHSAGGRRTTHLLRERGQEMEAFLRAVAFTDIKDPREQVYTDERSGFADQCVTVRKIYQEMGRNWIKTKTGKALDEKMKKGSKGTLCLRLSSGHSDHKYTTPSAFPSIVKFFEEKLAIASE